MEEEDRGGHIGRCGAQGCCQEAGAQAHLPLGEEGGYSVADSRTNKIWEHDQLNFSFLPLFHHD